jgi:hypothetical protein
VGREFKGPFHSIGHIMIFIFFYCFLARSSSTTLEARMELSSMASVST